MMASFKDFLAKKASSAPQSAGESAPPVPEKEARGLHLSGNSSRPAIPEVPDEQTLLRQMGILPPEGVSRKLGETIPDVPYVFHSETDSHERRLLKAALLAEETKLGVWINPESTAPAAWLAVQVQGYPNLLLLHRLPLLNRQTDVSQPF